MLEFNPVVGDIAGNTSAILRLAEAARGGGAAMLLTPGWRSPAIRRKTCCCATVLCGGGKSAGSVAGGGRHHLVIGHLARIGAERFNAATVLRDGNRLGQYHKMLLPNSEVFDECRYFTPAPRRWWWRWKAMRWVC